MGSGHFPCGSVDWNSFRPVHTLPHHRHFPCGSVDWNAIFRVIISIVSVTSLAEVWIEIAILSAQDRMECVTSLAEVWIEISRYAGNISFGTVTSLAEVWIEMRMTIRFWSGALSLPLRKCGLKSAYTKGNLQEGDRHFPCGSVDWNTEQAIKNGKQPSHFPCGSVDWNSILIGNTVH